MGPTGEPLPRFRHRWDARGGPSACLAKDPGSACAIASLAPAVAGSTQRAQAGRSRSNAHHRLAGPYASVGVTHDGVVYELFLTNLSQSAFTAADVVTLYLHRGAFENALSDKDQEQDPDRWCSHA